MEKFYELEDLTLLPTTVNNGHPKDRANFLVIDALDKSGMQQSLPIFTAPMEAIVGKSSAKSFIDRDIRPVLPLSEPIEVRLEYSQWIFCAFTMKEIKENFIDQNKRNVPSQFHLCIDVGNGHDRALLDLCANLRRLYGAQLILMGGNVGSPEIYSEYAKVGFDYMRVGLASSSLVDIDKFGFHWPMGSLLDAIKQFKKTAGLGLPRDVKIIADGGLNSFSSMIKALAIGADYVMIGSEFARVVEAGGTIYKISKSKTGETTRDVIDPVTIAGMEGYRAQINGLQRQYFGSTSPEMRAFRAGYSDVETWKRNRPKHQISDTGGRWVNIDYNLDEWVTEFKRCAYYAFMMTSTTNFVDLKKVARYGHL